MTTPAPTSNETVVNPLIETTALYMKYRSSKENDKLVDLVSEDVVVCSVRDGTHTGLKEVKSYWDKVKPSGTWEEPRMGEEKVYIPGKVKYLMMNWTVHGWFTFNDEGKISRIDIRLG